MIVFFRKRLGKKRESPTLYPNDTLILPDSY